MTKLSGLSEPSGHVKNALRMGTFVAVKMEGAKRSKKMMISAFLKRDDTENTSLYVVLTAHSRIADIEPGKDCSLIKGPNNWRLGKFVQSEQIFEAASKDLGFVVVELEEMPLFKHHGGVAQPLSTTKDFRTALWTGAFRMRRLNDDDHVLEERRKQGNQRPRWINHRCRAVGEIRNVEIFDSNETVRYEYCAVVKGKRGKAFGNEDSVGAPLISRSGALSGIIVGQGSDETVVLPVEELGIKNDLEFVTLGGDWPQVRVK